MPGYVMGVDANARYPRKVDRNLSPIDRLADPKHHEWVIEQIRQRLKASELEMTKFHPRWKVAERKFQAYMSLPKYEKMLRDMNNTAKPPSPSIIIFPYQYAVISTIVSYMMRVFCSRRPMFPLGFTDTASAEAAPKMETVLQYNADKTKLIARLHQFFMDGQLYGVCAMRNIWKQDFARRTSWRQASPAELLVQPNLAGQFFPTTSERKVYEGNYCTNVDPFMLLPDPSVPMASCNRLGEFIFAREFVSRIQLLHEEAQGRVKYLDRVEPLTGSTDSQWYDLSNRNLVSKGQGHAGSDIRHKRGMSNIFMMDHGSINIIPSDWGLGDSNRPQKFLFGLANRKQIIQAVALDFNHDMHPFVIGEPQSQGYGFGNPSMADYLGPIQDIMSWFLDSHIYNVRAALFNMFVFDPSRIEVADLKRPGPGKLIRLKPTAIGQDVRTAIQQLSVSDVTRANVGDLQTFMMIGDTVSAVSDNIRGVPRPGGRKTATEVRVSGEASINRLSTDSQFLSSQSVTDLSEQMVLNIQQYQSSELMLQLLGEEALSLIQPQNLSGEFIFPVHDGTLPLDRLALVEVWKEILQALMQDPELRMSYSVPRVFEHAAELAGAVNISSFKTTIANSPWNANAVPLNELPIPPTPGGGRGALPAPRFPQRPQAPAPAPSQAGPGRPVPPLRNMPRPQPLPVGANPYG